MARTRGARPWLRLVNGFTRGVLHTPGLRGLADHQVCELRYVGARTGRSVVLPVMYAERGDQVVVLVGGAERKRWWRQFSRPTPVRVWLRGATRTGTGQVATGATARTGAAAIYAARFPDIPVRDDPIVVITLEPVT